MSITPSIRIDLDVPSHARTSTLVIGEGTLMSAGSLIRENLGARACLIISDTTVAGLYLKRLEASLVSSGHTLLGAPIVVPAGEGSKTLATFTDILEQVMARPLDRHTSVVALGGGVVGDLAGFVASIALRGLDLVQIPTTLLAQVDSAVGGKNGINTSAGKNTLGTFWQPHLVIVDVTTLDSLPPRQLRAGYAETIKYGVLGDADFFAWCQAHGMRLVQGARDAQITAVATALRHKARIVAADERETSGQRALLNLGHTFGHALESFVNYDSVLLHGEAVAIGMVMALRLSANLGLCTPEAWRMLVDHFEIVGLPTRPPVLLNGQSYDVDALMMLMRQDKKTRHGELTLVLARGIGEAFVMKDVAPSPVQALWDYVIPYRHS